MADSVPELPADVTPEWLTLALRDSGVITTARVTECQTTIKRFLVRWPKS